MSDTASPRGAGAKRRRTVTDRVLALADRYRFARRAVDQALEDISVALNACPCEGDCPNCAELLAAVKMERRPEPPRPIRRQTAKLKGCEINSEDCSVDFIVRYYVTDGEKPITFRACWGCAAARRREGLAFSERSP